MTPGLPVLELCVFKECGQREWERLRPLNLRISTGYLVGNISGRGLEVGAPVSEAALRLKKHRGLP